ncbi:MAG: NAD(P)/FAD-dependent oxidoreductase, partial [Cyanobacteria bacterium HKST-UBA02]|nr:NAD(P)/FAD-dependent oxidoreductase [Cyanobacteria bacterium HKST-UBA02]
MSKRISRAAFLKTLAALAATGVAGKLIYDRTGGAGRKIPCRMLGSSFALGHRLRDGSGLSDLQPGKTLNKKLTIVGGGIAGLSAGWWLKRNGFDDFVILELEKDVGGNSRAGRNHLGAFPWGAHYVP